MTAPLNGRVTVYTNQVPFEADVLRSNSYKMADVSKLAETILGSGIGNTKLVSGLPCLPISPPGLQVTVGSGCLYSFESYDATNYGVLPADNNPNHRLYKQAINFDLVTLDTPAPLVVGNSIVYLVQGAFQTLDVNIVSRPYFNSSDPQSPIFADLSDTRTDNILINIKNGIESPSPTPPTPDAGFVPLYYVTVSFGQTVIVPNNITVANGAPFVTESLTQKVSYNDLRSEKYTYFQDVGVVNSIVVNPGPAYLNFNEGSSITVKVLNNVNGPSTISINGISSINIKTITPSGLIDTFPGQIISGGIYTFISDGINAQLINPSSNQIKFYGASVYMTANQIVPGTNAPTVLNFNQTNYDTNLLWDNANKKFIVKKIGFFGFNANIFFSSISGPSTIYLQLVKNGVIAGSNIRISEIPTTGPDLTCSGYIEDYASSITDDYQLIAYSNGSPGTAIQNAGLRFQMKYLGD